MNLKLKKPLAFFDLETTGINISNDRIIEVSVAKLHPNGDKEIKTMRLNPGRPIPLESSLIHGIYDEDVQDAPKFQQIAKSLCAFLEGCDLAGYNIVKFDVPMLMEEFSRAEVDFELKNRNLVDAQKIFHLMEPRTLSAAYKFFCNKELIGAHGAEADTLATLEVLDAQMAKYEGVEIKDKNGDLFVPILNDMEQLHKLSMGNTYDLAGRMVYNAQNQIIFNFGKHKDKLVTEVFEKESSYYDWMINGDFPQDTKKKLTEIRLKALKDKLS
jgi:DNA polymerase-3 subunit epsilon